MERLTTRGFELADWQNNAVSAWENGSRLGPHRGTFEIFTGGGKTLIALACAERASELVSSVRLAVVVPTEALARQWSVNLERFTNLFANEIGMLGAGRRDSFETHRVVVAVLNSAAKELPSMGRGLDADELVLIVDECHRAGAPVFSDVLRTPAQFRIGLSATPDREELDEDGDLIEFDDQVVGRLLGPVVFRFSLKDARAIGWLPEYEIHHHAITLREEERRGYDQITRKIDDLTDQLSAHGLDAAQARGAAQRQDDAGRVAAAWVASTSQRKDLLYRASERTRVASRIVQETMKDRPESRALLFHERVDQAAELHSVLAASMPETVVAVEHSRLPQVERKLALARFRSGAAPILVSVKSLIEGIDVPEADLGLSVASSSSVRQRVQSLGRVLRQTHGSDEVKRAFMHVLYVKDSVDDLIYAKEDWSDLTGEAANRYWSWPLDPDMRPEELPGPPHSPLPSEDQEWTRLGSAAPREPAPWKGQWPASEFSVDSRGTIRSRSGAVVANPGNVPELVRSVKGQSGGRFGVTADHRLVIVRDPSPPRELLVLGRLVEPFSMRSEELATEVDPEILQPGDPYTGPTDPANGKYKLGQKRGGVIERRMPGGAQFASAPQTAPTDLEQNARRVLAAWRSVSVSGMGFVVNEAWDAIYWDAGQPRFLARVPGGFSWPAAGRDDESELE